MSRPHLIALITAIFLLAFILELIRRRRLQEEYAWLWLLAAVIYLITAIWPPATNLVANLIGASTAPVAFTFLGLLFVVFILIQYSIRLSSLTTRVKDLGQHIAILDGDQKQLKRDVEILSSAEKAEEMEALELPGKSFEPRN